MKSRPPGESKRKRTESGVRRRLLQLGLPRDGRILLAVSGGADSTALLLILSRLTKNLRLQLGVAYFDHGMRGRAAARREERFVREVASSFGLPFFAGAAETKPASEAAAREGRYGFLADVAWREGYRHVATGHTASDQAETVLLNLVRGAGLDGLSGMQPDAPWPFRGHDLRLLRPLLHLSREETETYCALAGVEPVDDASNRSPRYRRNRVRHELLPLLRDLNPRIEDALVRLSDSARQDTSFIYETAAAAILESSEGGTSLWRRTLAGWPESLRHHALRLAFARLLGDGRELAARHLEATDRLVLHGKTGDRLDLPRNVTAILRRDRLQLSKRSDAPVAPAEPVLLPVPGEARFGRLLVSASMGRPKQRTSVEVAASAVAEGVCVRSWQSGDRMQPAGMKGHKKLQDLFTDEHVPRDQRDVIPLFVAGRGIVWVGGLRVAEWARPVAGEPSVFLAFRPA